MKVQIIILYLILGISFLYQISYGFEETNIRKKEIETYNIEQLILELEAKKKTITNTSEALVMEIKELKKNLYDNTSPWEQMKLENKLKRSQKLSEEINALNRDIEKAKDSYKNFVKEVIEIYNKEIKANTKRFKESKKTNNEIVQVLEELYKKRAEWKMKIEDEIFDSIVLIDIDISPYDGPKEINEIADILMDNYEELHKLIKLLERKKDELMEEREIRKAIGEFVEE